MNARPLVTSLCIASCAVAGCSAANDESPPVARAQEGTAASVVAVSVCDSVAARWDLASVPITRSDSMAKVNSMTGSVSACVVTAVTEDADSMLVRRRSYWADTTANGWRGITRWDADGPDGASRTLIRAGVRCQVDGEWDGSDDSNPAAERSKRVTERTTCWGDAAGVTSRDTSSTP